MGYRQNVATGEQLADTVECVEPMLYHLMKQPGSQPHGVDTTLLDDTRKIVNVGPLMRILNKAAAV